MARSRECVALKVKRACHRVSELRLLTACRALALHQRQDFLPALVASILRATSTGSQGLDPAGSTRCTIDGITEGKVRRRPLARSCLCALSSVLYRRETKGWGAARGQLIIYWGIDIVRNDELLSFIVGNRVRSMAAI